MAKFKTESSTLNKQLKKMDDKVNTMFNGISEKQDAIEITTSVPNSNNMNKQQIKIYTDNSRSAKLYFKDNIGNVYSLPLTKE